MDRGRGALGSRVRLRPILARGGAVILARSKSPIFSRVGWLQYVTLHCSCTRRVTAEPRPCHPALCSSTVSNLIAAPGSTLVGSNQAQLVLAGTGWQWLGRGWGGGCRRVPCLGGRHRWPGLSMPVQAGSLLTPHVACCGFLASSTDLKRIQTVISVGDKTTNSLVGQHSSSFSPSFSPSR